MRTTRAHFASRPAASPRQRAARLVPAVVGGALIATLALAGCSPQSGSAGSSPTDEKQESEFDRYLAVLHGESDDVDYDAKTREYENVVAACMTAEGFEYIPVDYSQNMTPADEVEDRNTEEWVARYGFGFLGGAGTENNTFVNPNDDYVNSLSEVERAAYEVALGGEGPTEAELADPDFDHAYDWKTAGCLGQADHEVWGETAADDPANAALLDEINELWRTADANPEIKAIDAKWSECMAQEGLGGLDSPMAAEERAWMAIEPYMQSETGPTESERKTIIAEEVKIALPTFACKQEVGYDEETQRIFDEMGQKFVDDNRAELDAMVARAKQAK